jgi:arylsulfatase A-like enzyme
MTGLHTGHATIRGNALASLGTADLTVAEVLQRAGYATALIGKWGLGEAGSAGVPTKKGFDYFFGYLNQQHAHNYYPTFLWRCEQKVPLRNVVPKASSVGAGVASEKVEYSHDLFEREALAWVEQHKDGPFFLYWALTIPHANNEAGKAGMEVPDLGPYAAQDWPAAEKGHAAMISRMDASVGRMMARLKELGIDGNTLVIFASDNGPHREGGHNPDFNNSRGPLRGIKRDLYEGGIRVPGIARWPGHIPGGAVSGHVWAFWDFLPTAAEIAGLAPPRGLDGISFLPALTGGAARTHEFLYWEFHEGGSSQAVRMGNWKAVRKAPKAPLELYDLTKDLGESHDLAAEQPEILRRIEAYLATARTESPTWPLRGRPATRPASRPAAG